MTKIVIDIPETAYEAFKEWHKNKVASVEQSIIANGTPYEDRPQGEWIEDSGNIACSHCHTIWLYRRTDYCPNCGADMRGDSNGN